MKHNMITSASGWRKVFATSGEESDCLPDIDYENKIIVALIADTFADYIKSLKKDIPSIALGIDTRPTGPQIAETMIKVLMAKKIVVNYAGIICAPEIMAYAKSLDGFVYISASHNPIGHNGIKFGLADGGVLDAETNATLVESFNKKINAPHAEDYAQKLIDSCQEADFEWILAESIAIKREAVAAYHSFAKYTIAGTDNIAQQNKFFADIRYFLQSNPLGILCDMNGSSRTLSIDSSFLKECGISFYAINNEPGKIAHGIIPEGVNLSYLANEMQKLHNEGRKDIVLGYMPDCDGDRGNIVYWDDVSQSAKIIAAQDVFALSVLSELSYLSYLKNFKNQNNSSHPQKIAISVNDPTSMRINEIANALDVEVFRAEVGEANVVNLARELRDKGYTVRILGEGSNGGNITHPAAVRDPLNTLFALLKLLTVKDSKTDDGKIIKGIFHLWCEKSNQMDKYSNDFTLSQIMQTLPLYTTTGVSEERAILKINSTDHCKLKSNFQKIFEEEWKSKKDYLKQKFNIASYQVICNNGTVETKNLKDYSISANGGLKILFNDENGLAVAFIWMRGSKTEPVFRIMCDVKGNNIEQEHELLEWETSMLLKADNN